MFFAVRCSLSFPLKEIYFEKIADWRLPFVFFVDANDSSSGQIVKARQEVLIISGNATYMLLAGEGHD